MTDIDKKVDIAAVRCRVLRVPRGYVGARIAGQFEGMTAGNAETARNTFTPHLWNDETAVKMLPDVKERFFLNDASANRLVGVRKVQRGRQQAVAFRRNTEGELEIISLHPKAYEESTANGTAEGVIVGTGTKNLRPTGLLWHDDGRSLTEIRGPGNSPAAVYCVDGQHQGGIEASNWPGRAAMWSGSADSLVSLHPQDYFWSEVRGICGADQVGSAARTQAAYYNGFWVPVMWQGHAESMKRLLPGGLALTQTFASGQAFDCTAGFQVGSVRDGDLSTGVERAILWMGSGAECLDLHDFVGDRWTDSTARRIYQTNSGLQVLGEVRLMSPDRRGIAGHQIACWTIDWVKG